VNSVLVEDGKVRRDGKVFMEKVANDHDILVAVIDFES